MLKQKHPTLFSSLQKAYSGEKAAAFAYIGHAASLQKKHPDIAKKLHEIENDEWLHREEVLKIMQEYDVPVSRYLEIKMHGIGRVISFACHFIGKFMPYYFAGKLESGNVCEYFVMVRHFHTLGITKHDALLHEMGIKEKEHEIFFLKMIEDDPLLVRFERIFKWGKHIQLNDVTIETSIEDVPTTCQKFVAK